MTAASTTPEQHLLAELCHQINSPLAAIRNALYLSTTRSQDPELLRYLSLADAEISSISAILRQACSVLEETATSGDKHTKRRGPAVSRRAAA